MRDLNRNWARSLISLNDWWLTKNVISGDGMLQGVVKWFNSEKGFGFIQAEGKDYFVYFKDIDADGFKTLKDGQGVTFKPDTSPKGPVAKQVKVIA